MNPIAITRKNYWQVNGTNHATEVEAFEDAANQAIAAPGSTVQVQPPMYDVVYTAPAAPATGGGSDPGTPPGGSSEPPPTNPPADAARPNIGAIQPGGTWTPPEDA